MLPQGAVERAAVGSRQRTTQHDESDCWPLTIAVMSGSIERSRRKLGAIGGARRVRMMNKRPCRIGSQDELCYADVRYGGLARGHTRLLQLQSRRPPTRVDIRQVRMLRCSERPRVYTRMPTSQDPQFCLLTVGVESSPAAPRPSSSSVGLQRCSKAAVCCRPQWSNGAYLSG